MNRQEEMGVTRSPSSSSVASATAEIDLTLHILGFKYTCISPEKLSGRLTVTKTCCQPFKMLNGGVSALIAESMASLGAYVASGMKIVAGIQLSTNHLRPALLGDIVEAEAKPVQMGKKIQVWEVELYKIVSSTAKRSLISVSKVTIICNGDPPQEMKSYQNIIKKYAKL